MKTPAKKKTAKPSVHALRAQIAASRPSVSMSIPKSLSLSETSRASFMEIPQAADGKTWKMSANAKRQWR